MLTRNDFQLELDSIFDFAERKRLSAIVLKSGDLHRILGDYPRKDHRMPICCSVMREKMIEGDEILSEPPSGKGASLLIKYHFPRNIAVG